MTATVPDRLPKISRRRPPRAVWAAGAVTALASTADNFVLFVLLWAAQPQGWSAAQTAVVVLALRLPTLATGVLLGRAVDRWGGRRLILLDLIGRAVLLLLLVLVSSPADKLPVLPVLVLGGLCGALAPASYAGVRWLVPRMVSSAELGRANAVVALGDQLPLMLGAAVAGPALALLGAATSMVLPAGMLLLAAALTVALPRHVPAPPWTAGDDHRPPSTADRDATRRLQPRVLAIIALSTAYYFAYGPFETASPPFVRDQLGATEGVYSLLWALFGLGALATLAAGPMLSRRLPGVVNAVGALVWGAVMLPITVVHDVPPAAVLFLVGGAIWGPYTTIETSALQRWVSPARHGAVFGLQRSLLSVATPLGAALAALALQEVAPRTVLAVSAGGCALAGALALTSRDLRRTSSA
ncbi:MFS transporter [Paractinoplanes globisporus]|uniref:MFS transporter n=1 Tax=Paractinoplanes globisporus TaxID=113565 RepID=A0ABW6WFG3_9ACTN|nr:MFS transporter [Actinoplanes globisporus]